MHLLEREIHDCNALVIDPNPASRSILAAQLRDLGMGEVQQCSRLAEARRQLETNEFDFVLCEMDFPGQVARGDELLNDLRRSGQLPLGTVFVMVTGEATYARVAEAAESALDSYLIKPFTALALADRLRQARVRKKTLRLIYSAVEEGRLEEAVQLCMQRFEARSSYWLYAARVGAELLLLLGRPAEAKQLFDTIVKAQGTPWARLGLARAQRDAGEVTQAHRTLAALLESDPNYADAHDIMGRVQLEAGQLREACTTYQRAAELTPGSLGRQQKFGMLAFYMGELEDSSKALQYTSAQGAKSHTFDHQSLVLLGFTYFYKRDAKGVQRCLTDLTLVYEKQPQSDRLRRFVQVMNVARLLLVRQLTDAVAGLQGLAQEIGDLSFDVEAACNLLTLIAALSATELKLSDAEDWVDRLSERFCSARGISELLALAASGHAPTAERVRQALQRISSQNEGALALSMKGSSTEAVMALLQLAETSMNARFLDTARGLLLRYPDRITNIEELSARQDLLRSRIGSTHRVPQFGAETMREPGSLTIRGVDKDSVPKASPPHGTPQSTGQAQHVSA